MINMQKNQPLIEPLPHFNILKTNKQVFQATCSDYNAIKLEMNNKRIEKNI